MGISDIKATILSAAMVLSFGAFIGNVSAEVVTWSAAQDTVATNGEYKVIVNGRSVDVVYIPRPCWHDNQLDGEENLQPYYASFFDADEEVTVSVESPKDLTNTRILPTSRGISPQVESPHHVTFRAKPPFNISFEPTPRHRALVFSANTPEKAVPAPSDAGVRYFAPGRHHFDEILHIGSNETLYLAPGAWVEAAVRAAGTNITICGRGVLSGLCWDHYKGPNPGCMVLLGSDDDDPQNLAKNIAVRDIAIVGSWAWTLVAANCENVLIDNVKILNGHVLNDDGIDICRSRNVTIRNCFIRAQDDCIAPKYWAENLLVENCTLWTDVANIIRIGYECRGPNGERRFSGLHFKGIDAIHQSCHKPPHVDAWSENTIQIQAANNTMLEDFLFEDFRIDYPERGDHFLKAITVNINTKYNPGKEPGHVRRLVFRNIKAIGEMPDDKDTMGIWLQGADGNHTIEDVVFENVDSRFPVTRRDIAKDEPSRREFTLEWKDGSAQPVNVIDFGPDCVGGFAVFEVDEFHKSASGELPVVRISYANHPDGLTPNGDFTRETSAKYLNVDNPVLPANINRHELYTIPRTGRFVAPLIQGQERYARIALDVPGTKVKISRFGIVNAGVHDDTPPRGDFKSDNPRDRAVWRMGIRTCQLASFPNPDAWRVVEGVLVPRKLEKGEPDGWCRYVPDFDGTLEVTYEFRRNPHFPKGEFKVFTGLKDVKPEVEETITQEGPDGIIKTANVILQSGRFGFSVAKEAWPMIHSVVVKDADGKIRWRDDFGSCDGVMKPCAAVNWVYSGAEPYLADGGKRDRLVWSGDLWWAQRTMYYAWGESEPYMRGALRLLAFNQTPEGFCHAAPYAENRVKPRSHDYGAFASDEFSAWLVPCAWEHYLFTGDESFAREIWPAVDRDLHYLTSRMGKRGLFEPRFETSKHADNMNCGDTYDSLYQNILLWMCWRDGGKLARALGDEMRAQALEKQADAHALAIRAHFKNADGSWSGTRGTDVTEERRMGLLVASGFCTKDEALWAVRSNRHFGVGKEVSLYVRGCFLYGFTRSAMREISIDNWYSLIHPEWKGAHCCTECLFTTTKGWWDESHPDASISDVYPAYILGVEPLKPGFREFRIAPQVACGTSRAEGRVPTRFGDIAVSWRMVKDDLTLDFTVPEGTVAFVDDGRFTAGRHTLTRRVRTEELLDESFESHITDGVETRDLGYTMSQIFYREESDYSQMFDLDRMVDVRRIEFFPTGCGFPDTLIIEGSGEDGQFRLLKRFDGLKGRKPADSPLVADVASAGNGVRHLRISSRQAPVMTPGRSWAVQFNNIRVISHVR